MTRTWSDFRKAFLRERGAPVLPTASEYASWTEEERQDWLGKFGKECMDVFERMPR